MSDEHQNDEPGIDPQEIDEQEIDAMMAFDEDSGFVSAEPQSQPAPPAQAAPADPAAGMDQLRGILLGPIAQDLQLKLTQLGQRLDGSLLELDRRTAERVTEVERELTERMDLLAAEMAEHREEHEAALRHMMEEFQTGSDTLTERLESLAHRLTEERRQELNMIQDDLQKLSENMTTQLVNEIQVMREETIDRESLSTALSEIALRLSTGSEIVVAQPEATDVGMDLEAAIDAASRTE